MNSRERVLAALSLEIPDRVPHLELAYNEASILKVARCFTEDLPEPDYIQRMDLGSRVKLFDAALLLIEELDVDGITLRVFPESQVIDELHFKDDWGVTFRLSPFGEAVVIDGPVRDESDLKDYRPPRIKESDLAALSYCGRRFKGMRAMVLSMQCPFRRSWNVLGGMQHLLMSYGINPNLVHQIARLVTDYTLEALELGVKLGADVISLDGDLAHETNMIMSPDHFREFLKPYYAEIVEFVHARGLKIFKHTDGDHWKIMEDLIELGFDGIHPIQPQSLDLTEVKKEIGDRICILGNIDCRETLCTKSIREVEAEVIRAIEAAAPGGGYILSSSNTIHPGVKAENYIAMVKATHEHGVYGTHGLS
jgi:uroporphyrinogen decarboxylase